MNKTSDRIRPKAQPVDPSRKKKARFNSRALRGPLGVRVGKNTDAFEAKANELAKAFGWDGKADDRLNEVQCKDAERLLTKVFHETHVAVLNGKTPPSAQKVLEELGLDKGDFAADDLETLTNTLKEIAEAERAEFGVAP